MLLLAIQAPSFTAVDAHADSAPAAAASSVPALAEYLARAGADEMTRTRAIYRWITGNINYDAAGLRTGNYGDLSPEGVLRRRVAVCQGYAQLAEALGTAMGLRIRVLSGWSKGYGYRPGQTFTGQPNHAWNAVQIGGRWRLMDPTWGAGYLDAQMRFQRRFQEHYFLTDPASFVFDHLPEDSTWQLLPRPIGAQEYIELVNLRPGFFGNGLRLRSHSRAFIDADGRVAVTFDLTQPAELLAQVLEASTNRPLDGSWALVQAGDGRAELRAAFPREGEYLLRLFAKPAGQEGPAHWALDYLVRSSTGSEDARLPQTFSSFTQRGVQLIEPWQAVLPAGRTQRFALRAPGALEVAIVANQQWTRLSQDGELFSAELAVPPGDVTVYARYRADEQFTGLLRYVGR